MDLTKIIKNINLNAEFSIIENDINQITWLNGTTPISKADIEAQLPIVEFEMAMEDLRAKRNQLLADCDWTQFVDSPLTAEQKFVYAEYRQQLRDITNGLTTKEQVDAIIWPTKPGA